MGGGAYGTGVDLQVATFTMPERVQLRVQLQFLLDCFGWGGSFVRGTFHVLLQPPRSFI